MPPSVQATLGGDNQRGNLSRCGTRGNDGFSGVAPQLGRSGRRAQPFGIGPRDRFDVGRKRRVIEQMLGRVLANDADDRNLRTTCVMQVRRAICETGTEMKQRACRLLRHACIAICSSRHHTFKKAKHTAHLRPLVQRGDDMHFGGAGIRETGVNASSDQRAD